VQGAGENAGVKSEMHLSREQASAALAIAIEHRPGMIQDMQNSIRHVVFFRRERGAGTRNSCSCAIQAGGFPKRESASVSESASTSPTMLALSHGLRQQIPKAIQTKGV
jgi:hypothetical protein